MGRPNVPLSSSIVDPGDKSANQAVPWILGSLFRLAPIIFSPALPTSNESLRADWERNERTDNGKGKARAVGSDEIDCPSQEPAPTEDEVFADMIREAIATSRRMGSRVRSPDEAGPSGSVTPSPTTYITPPPSSSVSLSRAHPSVCDPEQAEIGRAILMSSIENIENSFHTLRTNFVFPAQLDCHLSPGAGSSTLNTSPIDGETGEYPMVYLRTTPANSVVLDFVRGLRALLRQLDRINHNNDMEAESTKQRVAGAISRMLEDVESRVEEEVGKWMSLQTTEVNLAGQ